MKKIKLYAIMIIVLCCVFGGCGKGKNENTEVPVVDTSVAVVTTDDLVPDVDTQPAPIDEPVDIVRKASLATVGDLLYHDDQLYRAYDEATDTFDFTQSFKYFTKYLKEPDYMIANLETTFAGKNKGNSKKIHGYCEWPCFNTPEILATNLREAGVDMVTTVNNHSMDSGFKGLVSTLDYLDAAGLEHIGTYRTQEERDELFIKDINGISFGITGYTYCSNGISYDEKFSLKDLNWYTAEPVKAMVEEIKALDAAGVDFVVVFLHMGNEYEEMPYSYQKKMVDAAFEAGADIILGGHPHVLQPMEIREIGEGENTRTGYLIYSVGNFVSSQKYNAPNKHKDLGTMIGFEFQKINDEPATVERMYLVPTITYWSDEEISVLPVMEAFEKPESFDILKDNMGKFNRIEFAKDYVINHLTQNLDNEIEYKDYVFDIVLDK